MKKYIIYIILWGAVIIEILVLEQLLHYYLFRNSIGIMPPSMLDYFRNNIYGVLMQVAVAFLSQFIISSIVSSLLAIIKTKRKYWGRLFLYIPIGMLIMSIIMGAIKFNKASKIYEIEEYNIEMPEDLGSV